REALRGRVREGDLPLHEDDHSAEAARLAPRLEVRGDRARGRRRACTGRDRPDGCDFLIPGKSLAMANVSPHIVATAPVKTLSAAERAFLENPYVGVVTDVRPDGSLHSTVVWVDVDDEGVSFNTAWPRAKPRYIEKNPRVALLVVDPGDEYRWVSISGT